MWLQRIGDIQLHRPYFSGCGMLMHSQIVHPTWTMCVVGTYIFLSIYSMCVLTLFCRRASSLSFARMIPSSACLGRHVNTGIYTHANTLAHINVCARMCTHIQALEEPLDPGFCMWLPAMSTAAYMLCLYKSMLHVNPSPAKCEADNYASILCLYGNHTLQWSALASASALAVFTSACRLAMTSAPPGTCTARGQARPFQSCLYWWLIDLSGRQNHIHEAGKQ